MKSMTGYGKSSFSNRYLEVTAEVKSLNSKVLRVRFSMSKIFNPFINELNSLVSKFLKRGDVEIHVKHRFSPSFEVPLSVNYEGVLKFIKEIERISALSGKEITISMGDVFSLPEVIDREEVDEEILREPLLKAVEGALKELDSSRKKEGGKLKEYLKEKIDSIGREVEEIERRVPEIEERLFKKLKERVRELLKGEKIDEETEKRIELEVVLLAERQDVSEEISRLKAHVSRFLELLELEGEPVGKTLDFLCQEMHREITTLGNKLRDVDLTESVLKVKTEIARIKEQVQNVE
jgi:uncharacterized protein (TIGR00255 family)